MAKETHCQTQAGITSYSSQQMKVENSNREKLISIVEEQNCPKIKKKIAHQKNTIPKIYPH